MNLRTKIWALTAVVVACVSLVRAQDAKIDPRSASPSAPIAPMDASGSSAGPSSAPVAPARGVSSEYDSQVYDPAQVVPDTTTLAGAEIFSVGSLGQVHNIFDPSLTFSELGQAGEIGSAGQTGLGATALVGGSLSFNRLWSIYHLVAAYSGGENLPQGSLSSQNNLRSSFNNLVVAQDIDWERWRIHLRDNFVASPGAAFTGTGMGGPGLIGQFSSILGSSLNSVSQAFVPSETIQTGQIMRYMNTAIGEVEYSFNRRSAFSVSGSYGVLDFSGIGYVSSRDTNVQAGYDYLLDPKNSVAVLGSYGKIDYTDTAMSTLDYMAALAYGRKITGRLAFQAAAGPEEIHASGTLNGNFQILTATVRSALTYERRRSGISFYYQRGLSGGSGVFFGSTNNTFGASLHHQFTRFWSGSANAGYAFNRELAPSGIIASSFTNWFLGANVSRGLGHHAQVALNYGLQKQNNPAVCPVTSCGITGIQQTFGMTLGWHLRAIE